MTKAAVIQAQQRWEYKTLTCKADVFLVNELNTFGQDGWELVNAYTFRDPNGVERWVGFLKRPFAAPVPEGGERAADSGMLARSSGVMRMSGSPPPVAKETNPIKP